MPDIKTAEINLATQIRNQGGTLINLSDENLKVFCNNLDKDELTVLLGKYRDDREFYRNILREIRRDKFPNSFRYQDADEKLAVYNKQGLIIKTILDTKS